MCCSPSSWSDSASSSFTPAERSVSDRTTTSRVAGLWRCCCVACQRRVGHASVVVTRPGGVLPDCGVGGPVAAGVLGPLRGGAGADSDEAGEHGGWDARGEVGHGGVVDGPGGAAELVGSPHQGRGVLVWGLVEQTAELQSI